MSSFDRALAERLAGRESSGLLRTLVEVRGATPLVALPDGRTCVSFCSNDYLGLSRHPLLIEDARRQVAEHGVGSGGSRLVCGTHPAHRGAESALATLADRPAALLFPSAYAANVGALPAVFGRGDLLLSDALNHASIVDACRATRATSLVYPHGDLEAARRLLREQRGQHALAGIVSETLFSMDGDHPDLRALCALAEEYDAATIVDEAHALGVIGPHGGGLSRASGIRPDILVGGLGKALGCAGGVVAGTVALVRWLENSARTFVYSTAVPPAQAAVAARAAQLAFHADEERSRVRRFSARLRAGLKRVGLEAPAGETPIVPLVLGAAEHAVRVSGRLLELGFFVQAIRPPSVPEGTSRLRIAVTAAHTDAQVDGLVDALSKAV